MSATQSTHWSQYIATNLYLKPQEDTTLLPFVELHLPYAVYQSIKKAENFNLKASLLGKQEDAFNSDENIKLKLILSPDHWEGQEGPLQAQLNSLRETDHEAELLDSDNWMALSVRQGREEKEIGYRSFWDYVDWAAIQKGRPQEEEIFAAFGRFAEATGLSTTDIQDAISPTTISDTILESFQETLDELFSPNGNSPLTKASSEGGLFKQLVQFFVEEDWGFSRVSGEEELHIQFNGEKGNWMFVARVLSESQQILCYSYFPQQITETQRPLVLEFITRANHNMILGNFELGWDNGELRYKTSLDCNGMSLNQTVLRQVVFANVSLMDQYIAGIEAVVSGTQLPQDAIKTIEEEE